MGGTDGVGRDSCGRMFVGRQLRMAALGCAAVLALFQISCVILPVRVAPGVSGVIADQGSGQAVEGALVVVRFDGHYDDILPDREVLGHREAKTDAHGRFSIGSLIKPGISAWPTYRTEARVVAVMSDGYRCPRPQRVPDSGEVRIDIQRALDENDRRDSCSPVPAEKGDAVAYMAAWRALYPEVGAGLDAEEVHQLERLLSARSAFGFGENCEGPALDLALAPDGKRAAFEVAGDRESEVHVVELRANRSRLAQVIARNPRPSPRRLAWMNAADLVLWEPSGDSYQAVSPSVFSAGEFERIWSAIRPASRASGRAEASSLRSEDTALTVLAPEDLNDEGNSRWRGRSFVLQQRANPETGLPQDDLRVYREDATSYTLLLPGEVCGPRGRFGRPQYRIAADNRTSLDLRFVNGGCHVVRTDLETGVWSALDAVDRAGVCRSERSVQPAEFKTALRGYTRELESAIFEAGADPAASYALRIDPDGTTRLDTRGFSGESMTIEVPRFPLDTPLRRIKITTLSGGSNISGISKASGSATRLRMEPL
jgi:hypothetical protein